MLPLIIISVFWHRCNSIGKLLIADVDNRRDIVCTISAILLFWDSQTSVVVGTTSCRSRTSKEDPRRSVSEGNRALCSPVFAINLSDVT